MKIDITYPRPRRRGVFGSHWRLIAAWACVAAALACGVVNLCVGGPAWSAVAAMGLYTAWTLGLSPAMVECNRISQFIKLVVCACVLLALIDALLAPGWSLEVIPLVCSGALGVSLVLFFTDLERQKQNMGSLLLLMFVCMAGSLAGFPMWRESGGWALPAMGLAGAAALATCAAALRRDFRRELKRRFHTE